MRQGEFSRRYIAHVPATAAQNGPLPVVIALHGSGGNAESFLDEANWSATSDRNGFLVLSPESLPLNPALPATGLANPRVWNSGQFGSFYPCSRVDDVGFILGVLDDASSRWSVDLRRVYVAGFSNGGAMAFRLGAERADRFTAIASISGLNWVSNPHPTRAVPTLVVHGDMDPIVPWHGGIKVLPWEVRPSPPVRTVLDRWATAIGCTASPTVVGHVPNYHVKIEEYHGQSGSCLRVLRVSGQGHAWPGGHGARPERLLGPDLTRFDATAATWSFFQQWSW